MATIPTWLIGKYVSNLIVTPQTVTAAGLLGDGSALSLIASTGTPPSASFTAGLVDEVELETTNTTENVSAINRTRAHHVVLTTGYSMVISEILRTTVNDSLLASAWFAASGGFGIVKLDFRRARLKYLLYAVMTSYTESIQRGKNVGRLVCSPLDVGASTVTLTTGVD